ncbi:hypothetical protein [Streptosporangium canum]|uniref:hypothetical protein n=1 Tax=Streptosporangium canum TaxID=324952 RepID=UPI00378FDF7D
MPREDRFDHYDAASELRRIRMACGKPTYEAISTISSRASLGDGASIRSKLPTKTTLGNIFSGKHISGWETMGPVLWACYQYAKEKGLMPDVDPAAEARADWARLIKITDSALHHELGSSEYSPEPPGATRPSPMEASAAASIDEFSVEQRWHFNTYGQVGIELFRAASAGEGEAAYRLGVIATVDRHPRRARSWLAAASQRSHGSAIQLLASGPGSQRGQTLAAEHAYLLGHAAHHGGGDKSHAMFYYERAAKHGHSDAAYHLAHLFLGRGEKGTAARWFLIAGQGENLDAKRQLWKINKSQEEEREVI